MQNNNYSITFGTDGWRGIIGEDYTFANVKLVVSAISNYLNRSPKSGKSVIIGYDTRFQSAGFASFAANILSQNGIDVILSDSCVSTPAVSFNTKHCAASLGLMISASHNPHEFNGLKIKTSEGASAPKTLTGEIELLIGMETKYISKRSGKIERRNLSKQYLAEVKKHVDFNLIKRKKLKIVADPMYGAAIGYLSSIFHNTSCSVINIHSNPDPMFGGLHPEPIEKYLGDLKQSVKQNGADAGLATDGDADRIGVVDDKGRYLTPHQVFPMILYYLCKYKNMKGKVTQAISLGYVSERMSKDFGLEFEEVSIGFKNVAERICSGQNILLGGEESGGYGYASYLPERDGIMNSLVLMEMLAYTKNNMSGILKEIEKKYGSSAYLRTDFINPGIEKDVFVKSIKNCLPAKINGLKIKQIKDFDGIELIFEDDSWLLMRPSGTEPIIRIYCETPEIGKTRKIIAWGESTVKALRQGPVHDPI